MSPSEFREKLIRSVQVTSQKVLIAKRYLLKGRLESDGPSQLLDLFLKEIDCQFPSNEVVFFYPGNNLEQASKRISDSISWRLAFHEALWSLVYSGSLLISKSGVDPGGQDLAVKYYEGHPDSFRSRPDDLPLGDFRILLPGGVIRSRIEDSNQILCNSDLYLHEIGFPGLHAEVAEALQEAVRCLRNDLFLSAAVMIGRASEAAWIELAAAMSRAGFNDKLAGQKFQRLNIAEKMKTTLDVIASHAAEVLKRSATNLYEIRNAFEWSERVRDLRNSIHYGVQPSVSGNSYEVVGLFLLGATPHIRAIYQLIETLNADSAEKSPPH